MKSLVKENPRIASRRKSLQALDLLNIFLADVRDGVGPYLGIYLLATHHWDPASIGAVMSVSGIAGVVAQTPAGLLVDATNKKRLLIIVAAALIAIAYLMMVFTPKFSMVVAAQILIAFIALPIRGVLYTFSNNPYFLVSIQILDGIGARIYGVVSVLLVAYLTKGTGRFNFVQGAIATAVGIGASLSNLMTGFIVEQAGYKAGFLTLAGIATVALLVFALAMPNLKSQKGSEQS